MNIYESLLNKAINGGGGGTPTAIYIYLFRGTVAEPFDSVDTYDLVGEIASSFCLSTDISINAAALGFGRIVQWITMLSDGLGTNGCDSIGTANAIHWNVGSTISLDYALVFIGGEANDFSQYASIVPADISVYSPFPIPELSDYLYEIRPISL